jgi:hypothetical protein
LLAWFVWIVRVLSVWCFRRWRLYTTKIN